MIRSRDLHDLLELVACATARDEDTPFPLDVVLQLKGLLGADRAGYVEYHVGRPNLHQVETPLPNLPLELWHSLGDVEPTWALRDRRGRRTTGVLAVSDRLTRRQRGRNPWHCTVSRRCGIEDELKIWLPAPEHEARLFFLGRARSGRDFSEREHDLAEVLAPHLAELRRRWEARRRPGALTEREGEVLRLVARGLTNAEIAGEFVVATGTVRKHLDNIYEKLGVHTRTAAAAFVRR